MGDCRYYLKVRFAGEEAARELAPAALRLIEDVGRLHHEWQRCRGMVTVATFFGRNRTVLEAMEIDPPASLNDLCGKIESPAAGNDYECRVDGVHLKASGTIWHCATLDPLKRALERRFPGAEVRWASETQLRGADQFGMF